MCEVENISKNPDIVCELHTNLGMMMYGAMSCTIFPMWLHAFFLLATNNNNKNNNSTYDDVVDILYGWYVY